MKIDFIVFVDLSGKSVPAGRMSINEDGRYGASGFAYGRKYLERDDAIALDPVQLPLGSEVIRTEEDFVLFNGIRDAAPDAWGRKLIDIHMLRTASRPALEQDFLLVSQSGYRPGALRFGPTPQAPGQVLPYEIPPSHSDLGDLEALITLSDAVSFGSPVPDKLFPYIGSGIDMGGARPKGTVLIDSFPWLAKFAMPSDRIDMPSAEAGCLDLLAMAGIEVPECRIETVANRRVLLVKRFDRVRVEDQIHRIPMISSMSLMGAHEMDRDVSGYADIFNGLRRFGEISGAGEELFRRMVMNVLCGNTDDHYRNHAFLSRNGLWHMSPAYDVTPTLQASASRNLFLHLGKAGSGRSATLQAAVDGAPALGLRREQAVSIANELSAMVDANWRRVMSERGASQQDIQMMENSFSEAGKALDDPDIEVSGPDI